MNRPVGVDVLVRFRYPIGALRMHGGKAASAGPARLPHHTPGGRSASHRPPPAPERRLASADIRSTRNRFTFFELRRMQSVAGLSSLLERFWRRTAVATERVRSLSPRELV